jgi:penicillin-binding protein 1A
MKRQFARLRVPLWLLGVAAFTAWVWYVVSDVLGSNLLAAPAAAAFAISAALAGPPYRVPPNRWVTRLHRVPRDVRRSMKFFGRITLWRKEKVEMPGKRFAFFRTLSLLAAIVVFAGSSLLPYIRRRFTEGLPSDMRVVLSYDPTVATRVYSSDGELICTFSTTNRVRVPIDGIPEHVRRAFIAAEDSDFYSHEGIDPIAMVRAGLANFRGGGTRQGASTITQQVVKMVILRNSERTYRRKIQEILLAVELERRLSKDQILEIYLNHIFLGHGAYGVEAAAETYFGKSVSELNLAEAAMLAGLPQAPSRYSPFNHYDQARRRMRYVLGRMVERGYVTQSQMDEAMRQEIAIISQEDPLNHTAAPYFCDHVRRELKRMYGNRAIFEEGLTVRTTIDMRMQRAAEASVRRGLIDLERRIGFNGPEGHDDNYGGTCAGPPESVADETIEVARVASAGASPTVCVRGNVFPVNPEDARRIVAWEASSHRHLAVGDLMSVIIQTTTSGRPGHATAVRSAISARRTGGPDHPEALQAALVAVDPRTGELRALVGGYDFMENQFDNATMARRQPGSSIKPYVYLTALMGTDAVHGLTVDARMVDSPHCYETASGTWCPTNYENRFLGDVSLRTALAQSLNSVSVQLAARYGIDNVIRTMRTLGVSAPLDRVLPLAVGSADISPWEHTFAYASIASGGRRIPRHPGAASAGIFITRVTAGDGRVLYEYDERPREEWPQAVPPSDAYALTYLMRGVVEEGTGRRVRELRRPAAGKTGTTNDHRDVWFMGFTTDLVAGVWVGRTTPDPIGPHATGGAVALPIWLAFMQAAHPDTPPTEFPVPDDVALVGGPAGDLLPYQRGRMPGGLLSGGAAGNFAGPSPF